MKIFVTSNSMDSLRNAGRQKGVVLLIVLIMLVAMTLAGIGMMRSVDTSNVVAGNLAFKQTTTDSADAGITAAFNSLTMLANSGNGADRTTLNFNPGQPCPVNMSTHLRTVFCASGNIVFPGYSSTAISPCEVTNTCGAAAPTGCAGYTFINWYKCQAIWNGTPSISVTDGNNVTIATVNYMINRMCIAANREPVQSLTGSQQCQTFTPQGYGKSDVQAPPTPAFFYRITARSVGPRNTVSYTQSLVMISQ